MTNVAPAHQPAYREPHPTAATLARDLGLELPQGTFADHAGLRLAAAPAGLQLQASGGRPFHVNLARIDAHSGPGRSRRQPLARAVGLGKSGAPPITVLDATAGWGEDAWLLAMLGCRVLAVERHPVVAALLLDGLRRLAPLRPEAAERLWVTCSDARTPAPLPWRFQRFLRPDVIYLDPMFDYGPRGRRGAERRPLVLLRQIVGDDADAAELLDWALARARRVVVKRPLHGPHLADRPPAATHRGKSLRWDVYPGRG